MVGTISPSLIANAYQVWNILVLLFLRYRNEKFNTIFLYLKVDLKQKNIKGKQDKPFSSYRPEYKPSWLPAKKIIDPSHQAYTFHYADTPLGSPVVLESPQK